MSWTPPWRSRPSLVSSLLTTYTDPAIRPSTISRTKRERRLSDIEAWRVVLLRRRQDEQQSTVVIVRRKEIGHSLGGQIAFRIDHYGLAELADAPFEHGSHMVSPALEVQPQDLAHL